MPKLELIDENVKLAKSFRPMPTSEMAALADALSSKNKLALDRYLHNHIDAYPAS